MGHDESVGSLQVALATVRTQRDIHAGSTQDALGEGLFGGRRRWFDVDRLANGSENLFAVGGGHPAEVADLVEAVRQNVRQEAAGEKRHGDGFGLLDVIRGTVAPGIGDQAVAQGLEPSGSYLETRVWALMLARQTSRQPDILLSRYDPDAPPNPPLTPIRPRKVYCEGLTPVPLLNG